MYILGFDIGGTKCAVITAEWDGSKIKLLKKAQCPTDHGISAEEMIEKMAVMADGILEKNPDSVGISCGGPLDSEKGVILGPPNLPGWECVHIVDILEKRYDVSVSLQNDANACAVAEWKFGNGRGYKNVVFMTFGTGLGAGLIIDGRLFNGTNGNAGEVGHIRLADGGPTGFGKAGSFEGFCSGGGISQIAYAKACEAVEKGISLSWFDKNTKAEDVTAKVVADAAADGDETALEVYWISGEYLGRGLSIIIDILNPEAIIIGSIFSRCRNLLWDAAEKVIQKEALVTSAKCCKVLTSGLGENIGDYAAIATALL